MTWRRVNILREELLHGALMRALAADGARNKRKAQGRIMQHGHEKREDCKLNEIYLFLRHPGPEEERPGHDKRGERGPKIGYIIIVRARPGDHGHNFTRGVLLRLAN